jgi:hypothetical protein
MFIGTIPLECNIISKSNILKKVITPKIYSLNYERKHYVITGFFKSITVVMRSYNVGYVCTSWKLDFAAEFVCAELTNFKLWLSIKWAMMMMKQFCWQKGQQMIG